MTKQEKITVDVDILKYLYYQRKNNLVPEEELFKINLTKEFYHSINSKIQHGELVNIGVRGEVRTGKSTIGRSLS